ncbi:MAG: hypothetical protein K9M96_04420 [Deltaproteobacteria bacterium]|nr:hypothetical protein [Deltaproteobacteria bacterium]
MENEVRAISQSKDVGYLITMLRLAKQNNETDMMASVVNRLKEINLLKDPSEQMEGRPFENLRDYVNHIVSNGH